MQAIRPTSYELQVKVFEIAGCEYSHTGGDHLIYHYPGAIRPVVIPKYKEVPVFIIRNNMKVIGLSREKYLQILQSLRQRSDLESFIQKCDRNPCAPKNRCLQWFLTSSLLSRVKVTQSSVLENLRHCH